jgi:hypothetical protein
VYARSMRQTAARASTSTTAIRMLVAETGALLLERVNGFAVHLWTAVNLYSARRGGVAACCRTPKVRLPCGPLLAGRRGRSDRRSLHPNLLHMSAAGRVSSARHRST